LVMLWKLEMMAQSYCNEPKAISTMCSYKETPVQKENGKHSNSR
jgi:hypothetical protein